MRQGSFLGGVKVSEAEVQKAIMQFLRVRGTFFYRNNSGAYSDKDSGRFIRFGSKGAGDLIAIYPDGRFWSIEVKREGGKLSDDQLAFLVGVRRAGGVASCVESIADVQKVLANPLYLPERYQKAVDAYRKLG